MPISHSGAGVKRAGSQHGYFDNVSKRYVPTQQSHVEMDALRH